MNKLYSTSMVKTKTQVNAMADRLKAVGGATSKSDNFIYTKAGPLQVLSATSSNSGKWSVHISMAAAIFLNEPLWLTTAEKQRKTSSPIREAGMTDIIFVILVLIIAMIGATVITIWPGPY